MSEVINVTQSNFAAEVLQASTPVVVDFWAPWCGPCKMIAPVLTDIAAQRSADLKIVKVNIDEDQSLAAEYNVRSIPTLLLFVGGELKKTKVGSSSKAQLLAWIDESLPE